MRWGEGRRTFRTARASALPHEQPKGSAPGGRSVEACAAGACVASLWLATGLGAPAPSPSTGTNIYWLNQTDYSVNAMPKVGGRERIAGFQPVRPVHPGV